MRQLSKRNSFYDDVMAILQSARKQTTNWINQTLVNTYFKIGERIIIRDLIQSPKKGFPNNY